MNQDKTHLFWYSLYKFNKKPKLFSKHFLRKIFGMEKENYGDLLSKYIVEKLLERKTEWYNPISGTIGENLFAIGSILNLTDSESIVWGSGIISKSDLIAATKFKAVRGPLSRNRIIEQGKSCPEIYGDPAILLAKFFNPKVKKTYKFGIIPHINDLKIARQEFENSKDIRIINLYTHNVERTTSEILSCEYIISSSLHGLIVPHAYCIPAIWIKISDKLNGDNVKFEDYFLSVGIKPYEGEFLNDKNIQNLKSIFLKEHSLPERQKIEELTQNLLTSFPLDRN